MKGVMIAKTETEIVINNDIIVPIHEGALYSDDPKVIGSDRVLIAVIVDNGEELLSHKKEELKELFANPYGAPESLVVMNPIAFGDKNGKPLSFGSKFASRRFVTKEAKAWFKRLGTDFEQLKVEDDIGIFVSPLIVNVLGVIVTVTALYPVQVTITDVDDPLNDKEFDRKSIAWLKDIRRGK